MTLNTNEEWADLCKLSGVWKRGEKCGGDNKEVVYLAGEEKDYYYQRYCSIHADEDGPIEAPHDIPPPSQSDPKTRTWVAMELLRALYKRGSNWTLYGDDQQGFWLDYYAKGQWVENNLLNENDPIDAIFAAGLAFIKEREKNG